ncbi:bldA-regulated nucleotide binding protein [Streptomyces davaonensis JCM 4913]|uniref:BldA-regulated nucleotide binding protein n=1 Tax=Streptomyces davaonensis (strain DSM 101723 / JCM 4913 / KCC S-0913 / 768) TaxID=1214101 RepID=K4R2G3_STRDJ|nr:bldA-regulated nucleotide-binding protein [Streptomyces davaonensis]CCK26839.1 bldA-regulated nucleotide binding protein [Streptomyces davaonensis JCM 4913]
MPVPSIPGTSRHVPESTASEPPPEPSTRAPRPATAAGPARPHISELRLSAFAGHRRVGVPLGPVTVLAGPSGCGKTTALRAYEALARLGSGAPLAEVFPDPVSCVPDGARPDAQRRRGFRIGCTADGPEGPVRLDVAVQAEPDLRIVGERLTADGVTLLETALRDPGRRAVQAAWHTAGSAPVTRAPLPDDHLGTALLPLRVAGKTDGQRRVLAAAEQMVVALRSVFPCDPRPDWMRVPVPIGPGRLLGGCDNLADVLWRTRQECARRHQQFVTAVRAGCLGPVTDVLAEPLGDGTVRGVLDRGDGNRTDFGRLGDGELRYLALTLVLLTGPGVLEVDPPGEVPPAMRTLTVLTDGLERALDPRQRTELLALAARMGERGHIRLLGTAGDPAWARGTPGAAVVDLNP